jgi:hypothetical protein
MYLTETVDLIKNKIENEFNLEAVVLYDEKDDEYSIVVGDHVGLHP